MAYKVGVGGASYILRESCAVVLQSCERSMIDAGGRCNTRMID